MKNKYVWMYLLAVVAANISVSIWGPSVTVLNAFLFIAFDLTSRDKLHEAWHGNGLLWKMLLLIASGSVLSFVLNSSAGPIAIASFVSFALSSSVDAITYQLLGSRAKFVKVNGSNVFSAAVDSIVFPTLAFGVLLWPVIAGQFAAKVFGGFVWSIILNAIDKRLTSTVTSDTL